MSRRPVRRPVVLAKTEGFELREDGIYEWNEEQQCFKWFCRRIDMVGITEDIEKGTITITLEFDALNGVLKTAELPRARLTYRGLDDLMSQGADVFEQKRGRILQILEQRERTCPRKYCHSGVGFFTFRDWRVFRHLTLLGSDLHSEYRGTLDLRATGSYEDWKTLMVEEVMGYPPSELGLLFGLSAPVVAIVREVTGGENLIVHLCGDSSTGKTTMARVAVSPFGLPDSRAGGLIFTWNNTRNALLGQFRDNYGVPMVLDEASMSPDQDLTGLIYSLAEGKDKGRQTQDAEMKKPAFFRGLVLSTGEFPISGHAARNTGIKLRVQEFEGIQWTRSAENSDAIKAGLLRSYGHAGPRFVEYLLARNPQEVVSLWRKWRQVCLSNSVQSDRFADRRADRLAVLLATAELAGHALDLQFDTDGILALLLRIEAEAIETRDLAESAYVHFLGAVQQYQNRFVTDEPSVGETYGRIMEQGGHWTEILILPSVFQRLMVEGQFQNPKLILKEWARKGWLDHDDRKMTRKRTIQPGSRTKALVHVVRVREEFIEKARHRPERKILALPASNRCSDGQSDVC